MIGQLWLGLICALISFGYVYFLFQGLRLSGNLLEQVIPKSAKMSVKEPATAEAYNMKSVFPEMHPFENIEDPNHYHLRRYSIDQSIDPEHIWILLEGQVAFITPKPEGGFQRCLNCHHQVFSFAQRIKTLSYIMESFREFKVLSFPYRAEQWHTLQDKLKAIKEMAPFFFLSPEWQWMLATQASQQTIPAEQYLLEKDTPSDTLYMLTHGDVLVEAETAVELSSTLPSLVKWASCLRLPEMPVSDAQMVYGHHPSAHIIRVCLQQQPSMQAWMTSLVQERLFTRRIR